MSQVGEYSVLDTVEKDCYQYVSHLESEPASH